MDENNNGPVPGIIGQDISSEPAVSSINNSNDDSKIFDSSAFTGVESESLVLNGDQASEKQKKPKGPNIFTKWQLWAITSGVIAVAAIVTIFIMIGVYEGKLASANAVAGYDASVSDLEKEKKNFEEVFAELARNTYGVSSTYKSSTAIYPTDEQILEAKNGCLGRFGVSADDINYIDTLKTGDEILKSGENVVDAKERLVRIVSGYNSANTTIANCRENVLSPILSQFDIKMGQLSTEPHNDGEKYLDFYQPIKIKYKGTKAITNIVFEYDLVDRNGVSMKTRSANYRYSENKNKLIKKGDEFTIDLYTNYSSSQYYVYKEDAAEEMKYKPVLKSISGSYEYKY